MTSTRQHLLIAGAALSVTAAYILFATVICALLYLGVLFLPTALSGPTPAPGLISTPGSPSPSSAPVQPQPTPIPDDVIYKNLAEHFEKVTTIVLTIVGVVTTLLGIVGIGTGYLSFKPVRRLQNLIDDVEEKVGRLEQKVQATQDLTDVVRQNATHFMMRQQRVLELQSPNLEVRIRAVQTLGASNDIFAVSYLVDLLRKDEAEGVRAEAAYGLRQLLAAKAEPNILMTGIQCLTEATEDPSELVRLEAIEALDTFVCNKVELPRTATQRLRELAKHDKTSEVVEAAKLALEHIKQHREGSLNSQTTKQESE
jgi:hypothetical protein